MCKDVPLTKPEKSPQAMEWDGMTVETFKNQTLWTSSMLHFSLMFDKVNRSIALHYYFITIFFHMIKIKC